MRLIFLLILLSTFCTAQVKFDRIYGQLSYSNIYGFDGQKIEIGGIVGPRTEVNPAMGGGVGAGVCFSDFKIPFRINGFLGVQFPSLSTNLEYLEGYEPKSFYGYIDITELKARLEIKTMIYEAFFVGLIFSTSANVDYDVENKGVMAIAGFYDLQKDKVQNISRFRFAPGFQVGGNLFENVQVGLNYSFSINSAIETVGGGARYFRSPSWFVNYLF